MNNKTKLSLWEHIMFNTIMVLIVTPGVGILWGIGLGVYKILSFFGLPDPYPIMIIIVLAFIFFVSVLDWVTTLEINRW